MKDLVIIAEKFYEIKDIVLFYVADNKQKN